MVKPFVALGWLTVLLASCVVGLPRLQAEPRATFKIPRPNNCQADDVYHLCYMCARIVDNLPIYHKCCDGASKYVEYCKYFTSK